MQSFRKSSGRFREFAMASLKTIAARAKISMATASRAMNDHAEVDPRTRERVLRVAEDLGYRTPAERKIDAGSIGLVQATRSGFYDYDALVMRGMIEAGTQNRFDVTWIDLSRDKTDSESYSQFFRRKNIRGVVLRSFGDSRHVVESITAEGFPAVAIGEKFDEPDINWIRINGVNASRHAIEHLIALGHKQIALVMHSRPTADHADRRLGFRTAMQAAGIDINESFLLSIPVGPQAGAVAINRLLALPTPPTAIYFTDPEVTVGAINRCHELQIRIPEDLSIVGFDDGHVRRTTWPRFAAVCQETWTLGSEASAWLSKKMAGLDPAPLANELEAHFEVLQSTGVPPTKQIRVLPDGTRLSVE
jgi:DNA-binding LacI/PurR family transcriptional regulator